ncbi:hypothetical protein JTB14_016106 [Gonioctena quinquepunctata]|nr:hypothetical protein JTB14_016106 [Gonioctena quinquepunctata]
MIREYVHENAALVDELEEVQINILVRKEERKFLLRKLCEYDSKIAQEVQNAAKDGPTPPHQTNVHTATSTKSNDSRKNRKKHVDSNERRSTALKSRKSSSSKSRKKFVRPVPIDQTGKPIFPIELGRLKIHSLGYVSTRIYGSLKDPTQKCVYTCTVSDMNGTPRFEIASDDNSTPIIGDTPDVCHSLLLQGINDSLSLNVVSTRPRGHEFFGLTHPTVLHLIQSSPGSRKCIYYKWIKFEVSKNHDAYSEDNDAGLSYEYLQRSINYCKYKMAPDILQKPEDIVDSKDGIVLY